ncbi:oxidation resistance protein 1 isoform X3 [Falco rusticolus]|uniref:oxidation resistance protein 1 isoform X3 n=1 Tax=Falco rusticolus TaxID=120794 RepID=UPI001886A042|nr:oxidation resistance protein 1 isoform X3 [Falco rusticolus]XP_055560422.1 oxidation resistance protein 1 isoform X3 [Falco cherrug]
MALLHSQLELVVELTSRQRKGKKEDLSWRLKKKSQSVDISGPGCNPVAAEAQTPQPSKSLLATKTATAEEEQNNTTNTQRHNPRRSELKRYYTIDTGQKKTPDKKDGRRMSFQKPKGTIEYSVESRDTLNSIALKFDTTPNELVQLNKLFSRAVVPGQILYVPDPDYISSVDSSPSLSPISPLSPTSSEAELDKATVNDPDGVQQKELVASTGHVCVRPTRVVSSTSEEEEAFTEKFLKINCKYITNGKGTVNGVLLVTPNNIMFDPHKMDPLVQENGCEEYGIMCPMEEVMSAALYKEIADSKIKDSLTIDVEQLSVREPCYSKKAAKSNTDEMDSRIRDTGNDSASTAPRSTEESLSEDVFTESELSPIREELVSSDELRQEKSSGASSESVQTINQTSAECLTIISDSNEAASDLKPSAEMVVNVKQFGTHSLSSEGVEMSIKGVQEPSENIADVLQQSLQGSHGSEEHDQEAAVGNNQDSSLGKEPERDSKMEEEYPCCKDTRDSQKKKTTSKGKVVREQTQDSETEAEELRKLWKTHTMQQTKQQRENVQQDSQKEISQKTVTAGDGQLEGPSLTKEKRRHRSHKFLRLRVGKPMRKTFVSQASASMQQYAQRDKKHEYWFAVPQERTDHLYVFFIQWSPEIYAEDTGESLQEPGFIVVKKKEEPETSEESTTEDAAKEWEITTREDINSKQATNIKTELEPEAFRPNLSDPSELLQPEQIEKLTKSLPPRTIGYPWTLVYSTGKHGMSLKTLYRTMLGLDTPVLLVIKDSDGQVFGALASEPFKVSDGFYGTGETFMFTFSPDFEVFKWTGDNMFFIKGDMDSLAFGGGGGEFALWLDGDLYHGRSHSCKTFGNHTLSKREDFIIQDIEIWAFE